MQLIKDTWEILREKYKISQNIAENTYSAVVKAYSQKNRHYHNLDHIADLLAQADKKKNELQTIDNVRFAIIFHDVIYKSTAKDNEEQSAIFAQKTLEKIEGLAPAQTQKIVQYILATKQHLPSVADTDLQFFLDADLSILASEPLRYQLYTQQIRKEYRIYPNFVYRGGRKKALLTFLERKQIFYFYGEDKEKQARENISNEISYLSTGK
jgi:predicted metal-dependent HD superfamily phosphohydrolase